jgi:hypothetical protein
VVVLDRHGVPEETASSQQQRHQDDRRHVEEGHCAKNQTPKMVEYQVASSDRSQSNAKNVIVTAKRMRPMGANFCADAVFESAFVLSCSVDHVKKRCASQYHKRRYSDEAAEEELLVQVERLCSTICVLGALLGLLHLVVAADGEITEARRLLRGIAARLLDRRRLGVRGRACVLRRDLAVGLRRRMAGAEPREEVRKHEHQRDDQDREDGHRPHEELGDTRRTVTPQDAFTMNCTITKNRLPSARLSGTKNANR